MLSVFVISIGPTDNSTRKTSRIRTIKCQEFICILLRMNTCKSIDTNKFALGTRGTNCRRKEPILANTKTFSLQFLFFYFFYIKSNKYSFYNCKVLPKTLHIIIQCMTKLYNEISLILTSPRTLLDFPCTFLGGLCLLYSSPQSLASICSLTSSKYTSRSTSSM